MSQRFCSKCKDELNTKARYCRLCKAKYMREWRKTHKITEEQRLKGIVRSKTKMLIKRGKLIKLPCEVCNENNVEAHHDDYSNYRNVRWLCVKHHKQHHIEMKHI